METKVKDLTVGELQSLIVDTIRGTLEDVIEDIVALSSDEYLRSIDEARRIRKPALLIITTPRKTADENSRNAFLPHACQE